MHISKQFFVTATGTDIGKTFIVEKLCRKLIAEGEKVVVIKPIISGFAFDDLNSDSAKILKVLGREVNQQNLAAISPFYFKAPLSPNIAAALENKTINFSQVVNFCQQQIAAAQKSASYLLIEGAGGVMSPVNDDKTFADLIAQLKIPAILVTGNYLGTISHTLTAIAALKMHNIVIDKIILNCRGDDQINFKDNLKTLRKFTDVDIELINH